MKFLDLFAGIGGFRLGMERAGHECIGFCEIDQFARKSYKAIHDTEGEFDFHDITRVTDESVRGIGRVDVICGGFPCQAFSIAGKRAGFEDTRGTLFFEIARFASILRPKYLFLENVTGLLNHDNGNTFETILGALDELGYDAEWQVFNSKNFGVPQNRERVFIIGHLRGAGGRAVFPFGGGDKEIGSLQGQSTNTITARYGEAQGSRSYIIEGQQPKIIQRGHGYNQGGEHDITPTLTSNSWQENNHVKVYDFY
ncbi:DNA cytosine methyltransferase, partial [Streptococcus suis]|uniref:DNA cytosine methyltransferase n=1 Tax=Streptococcus suis TaxID=1307 RepID=UPI0024124DD5